MLYTRTFVALSLVYFLVVASFGSFFLFPLFIASRGGTHSDIGIIMGAFTLASVLCRPWISEMIDRIGRKRSFTLGALVMALLPLAYLGFTGSLPEFFPALLLVRIVHGVGLAICATAAFTYAADIIPEGRLNEGIGMFGVSGLTGLAVGPIIAEFVLKMFGFSTFFITSAALAALGLVVLLPIPESRSFLASLRPHPSISFFGLLTGRKIAIVAALAFLFGVGQAVPGNFVSPFARERAIALISLYFIAYSAAAIGTRFFGARVADSIGEEKIVPYALVLNGVGILVLDLVGGSLVLMASGLLTGCGHGLLFPSLGAMAIRNESIEVRGKINGIYTGAIDAGTFVGAIALGYIGDWAGYRLIFMAAGLTLLLGLLVFPFHKRP